MISILIATKNRPLMLMSTIHSILKNSYQDFEIIVADQSDNLETQKKITTVNENRIKYFSFNYKNKSRALNACIKHITSDIVCFTDDDCIVNKNWLESIITTFNKYPIISGVFGNTLPYEPQNNRNYICPSTTKNLNPKITFIRKPGKHYEEIGLGNNMAFKTAIFKDLGGFAEWLGPGTPAGAAEDAELAFRVLMNKKTLYFNSKMIVYHNRWLTRRDYKKLELSYMCGEMACYGYFSFKHLPFATKVVNHNFLESIREFKKVVKATLTLNTSMFTLWLWFIKHAFFRTVGLAIGWYSSVQH